MAINKVTTIVLGCGDVCLSPLLATDNKTGILGFSSSVPVVNEVGVVVDRSIFDAEIVFTDATSIDTMIELLKSIKTGMLEG